MTINETNPRELAAQMLDEIGLCTCGDPHAVASLLIDALDDRDKEPKQRTFSARFPMACEYFILLVLDEKQLIEHGAAVTSGWLTPKGRDFLQRYAGLKASER